jgi:putative endonuclease
MAYVYILSNKRLTVLYTGVTNDLERRVFEHKAHKNKGFTNTHNCTMLLYYEEHADIQDAIHREKLIKKYKRKWKRNLINSMNPEWKDLAADWYDRTEFEIFWRIEGNRRSE